MACLRSAAPPQYLFTLDNPPPLFSRTVAFLYISSPCRLRTSPALTTRASIPPEAQALVMRARALLDAAISLGDASSKSGGKSHGDSRRANGLPVEEDEEGKDALVASATARIRMGRLLLGGLYMQEDVVRARKLLQQAASLGEQSATRCQLFDCVCVRVCVRERESVFVCACVCGVVVPCAVVSCLVRACVCA